MPRDRLGLRSYVATAEPVRMVPDGGVRATVATRQLAQSASCQSASPQRARSGGSDYVARLPSCEESEVRARRLSGWQPNLVFTTWSAGHESRCTVTKACKWMVWSRRYGQCLWFWPAECLRYHRIRVCRRCCRAGTSASVALPGQVDAGRTMQRATHAERALAASRRTCALYRRCSPPAVLVRVAVLTRRPAHGWVWGLVLASRVFATTTDLRVCRHGAAALAASVRATVATSVCAERSSSRAPALVIARSKWRQRLRGRRLPSCEESEVREIVWVAAQSGVHNLEWQPNLHHLECWSESRCTHEGLQMDGLVA